MTPGISRERRPGGGVTRPPRGLEYRCGRSSGAGTIAYRIDPPAIEKGAARGTLGRAWRPEWRKSARSARARSIRRIWARGYSAAAA